MANLGSRTAKEQNQTLYCKCYIGLLIQVGSSVEMVKRIKVVLQICAKPVKLQAMTLWRSHSYQDKNRQRYLSWNCGLEKSLKRIVRLRRHTNSCATGHIPMVIPV